jgi:hypothetical protein
MAGGKTAHPRHRDFWFVDKRASVGTFTLARYVDAYFPGPSAQLVKPPSLEAAAYPTIAARRSLRMIH